MKREDRQKLQEKENFKSKLNADLPSEFDNLLELFERFDMENEEKIVLDDYCGKLTVEVISIPSDKKVFLFELRKISNLSISELMQQLKTLPFTIMEEMCIIYNSIDIKNLPEHLAINLIKLKETYPDSLRILFKEKSEEDCVNYDKYPLFSQKIIPETSDIIELK